MRTKPLAQGRVVNFWGGVYLRFLLAGPGQYMVRIARNSSLNTELSGIFIDPEIAKPDLFTSQPMACMSQVQYRPPPLSADPTGDLTSTISVWHTAQHAYGSRGAAIRRMARLLCYRYAMSHHAPANLLANWRWHLDIWKPQDRQVFDHTMNMGFRSLLGESKRLKPFMIENHMLQPNSGEMGHE